MEFETYADVIDAYNADNMGYSTLTDYIKDQNIRIKEIEMDPIGDMRKIFENKADGGMIGIEVLFKPKREEYQTGGRAYDSRATTQDFTNALRRVSAGTTNQQQADAKRYARQEAEQELRSAIIGGGLDNLLRSAGPGMYERYRSTFTDNRPGTNRQGAFTGTYRMNKEALLNELANRKLQFTSYAPKPRPKTYRTVSPEAQALNMSQATYEDIIRSGADPQQYYMDYQNRMLAGNPNLLKYGQVIGPVGMIGSIGAVGPGATPPTQAQINQMMQTNPAGYADFADLVKTYSADPYKGLKEEIKDVVGGRDKGYMSAQDYYDINVLGLTGQEIAEKYGLQYADGGRVGLFMGGPPLTGTALDIYNSMSAYGFSDAEIADALRARGLYDVAPVETPVINTAPNIINQDRGGDGQNNEPPGFDKGYSSSNFGLGPNKDVVDYEAEAYNIGPTVRGTFARTRTGIQNLISKMRSLPTPINIALNLASNVADFFNPQREVQRAINREEVRDLQDRIDKGQFGSPTPTPQDKARGDYSRNGGSKGTGGANPYGGGKGGLHAKDGGLATMFKTRRR